MNEIEFCEHWCGELTDVQRIVTECCIKKGQFLGVGRAVGRMVFMPLIQTRVLGASMDVIDAAGYRQLASVDGTRAYMGPDQ
jgi:hypothetical protein